MNSDSALFQAILAMDAYNRIGDTVTNRNLVVEGTRLGNVQVSDQLGDGGSGFFAVSYTDLITQQKMISYRGTDTATVWETTKDIWNGWRVGMGYYSPTQAERAAEFFQRVAGGSTLDDLYNANILLTGHSLGGGLAGLVASIYRQSGIKIFDSMNFTSAAINLRDSTNGTGTIDEVAKTLFFRGSSPTSLGVFEQINYSVQGQGLSSLSGFSGVGWGAAGGALNRQEYGLGFEGYDLLGPIQRHSSALAVLMTYAYETGISNDWINAGRYFLPKLFDNSLAELVGAASGGATGDWDASDKILAMIGYSAIDDGVLLYGNTAIRALFNDGNDLGKVLAGINPSKTLTDSADAIGKILAQYAGQLAFGKDTVQGNISGVLSTASDQLIADLAANRWTTAENPGAKIVGRDDLIKTILSDGGISVSDFSAPLTRLWGDPTGARIDRIVVQTKEEAFSGSIPERPTNASQDGITLFVTSGKDDIVLGSSGNDAIYGGAGEDNLSGGDGSDLLVGGDGNDILDGGEKNDLLVGGALIDTLKGGAGNDELWGGNGRDKLWGGADNDLIRGGGQDDTVYADTGDDTIFGEEGKDTFRYKGDGAVTGAPNPWDAAGVELTLGSASVTAHTGQSVKAAVLAGSQTGSDKLVGVEVVELTDGSDTLRVQANYKDITDTVTFDALGESTVGGDRLDLTALAAGVSTKAPSGNKIFLGNLTFVNFEDIQTGAAKDSLNLTLLHLGDGPTAAEEQALADLRSMSLRQSDPGTLAQAEHDRLEQARLVSSNQENLTVGTGGGDDTVVGSATGVNLIDGGEGNDYLKAGGFVSTIHGGAGTDIVVGGGFGSELYGDAGSDLFGLADATYVRDASAEDYAVWGGFTLTGGVQQWWQEGGWAYWAPFTSIASTMPLGFLDVFGFLAVGLDMATMTTVRYGLTESNQLIVQFARGRGGQAVIDDYNLDLDTGAATAHIVAFRQVQSHGSLDDIKRYINLAFLAGFGGEPTGTDPLVLDLDGDGLELTRPDAANVYFDIDHDGFSERTAWVSGDDGFLARDINGNGKIDDISELFGDATTTGFSTLATLDSNQDGKISAADSAFATLRVWRDLNGNGVTDAGELKTLAESGITEISLAASTPAQGSIRGNAVTAAATFTRADGTTSTIADVILQSNQTDSKYLGDATVSSAAAATGMNLKGFGALTDLAVAMSHDATLLADVTAFKALAANTGWTALRADAQAILFRWAGVDDVTATSMGGGTFDTQKLALIELYTGQPLAPRDTNGQPTDANVAELIDTWNDILDKVTIRLAVQGPLHAVFDDIAFDLGGDRFVDPGASALADAYRAAIGQLSSNPAAALADWNGNWGPALVAYADALVRTGGQEILTDYAVQSLVSALDDTSSPLTLQQLVAGLGLSGVAIGTGGNDTLARGSATGSQVFVGGDGNDTMTGGAGQDVYVFGRDFGQDDIFDSDNAINGDRLRLALYNPDDVTITREGNNLVIHVIGSTDKITIHDQYEAPLITLGGQILSANHAIEEIQFADGTIYEAGDIAAAIGLGTNGNDTIDGTAFYDEIEGLKGDDLLRGGDGGDTYYYTRGDGHDTIQDVMTNPAIKSTDMLFLFGGITPDDIHLVRNGNSDDVTLNFGWSGDSITLKGQFGYTALGYGTPLALDNRVDGLMFYGGAGWTWRDLQAATIATYTTENNDITYGFGTGDQFYASGGNDLLVGYDGGDTYRFGLGSGNDTIHDQLRYPETFISGLTGYGWGDDDVLEFGSGINPGDVTFSRLGAAPDLLISVAGSSDTMTIEGQFTGVVLDIFGLLGMAWWDRVEKFKFADGTILTWEDVLHTVTTGTSGNDTLYGAFYPDAMDGKAGDDYLSGGDDGDTYIFGLGYGHDVIEDKQYSILNTNPDVVQFGAGISASDLTFTHTGNSNDVVISIANSTDTLTIKDQFLYFYNIYDTQPGRIELLKFADGSSLDWEDIILTLNEEAGTSGNDTIYGFAYADLLDGGAGNDFLSGGNESDTYIFGHGYGSDTIRDNVGSILAGDTDVVQFKDAAVTDVTFLRNGNSDDLKIVINGTSDVLTVQGQFNILYGLFNFIPDRIESFEFAGGAVLSWEDIIEHFNATAGTSGNDTIYGFSYEDTLSGGLGDDALAGGRENDTYVYTRGDGNDVISEVADAQTAAFDTLALHGIAPASVSLVRNGNDIKLVIAESSTGAGDGGSVLLKDEANDFFSLGVEQVTFDNGTVWTQNDLRLMLLAQASTAGNDTITGFNTNDIITGGAGNDTMDGGAGDDTYVYARGAGNDVIIEGAGGNFSTVDKLVLENINPASVSLVLSGNDVTLVIAESAPGAGDGSSILLKDEFSDWYGRGVETVQFADGTIWTQSQIRTMLISSAGTPGDDVINGSNLNDVLAGGHGNDAIAGGAGDDTYLYARGDGNDVITEVAGGNYSSIDRLVLEGVDPESVTLGRSGNHATLYIAESTAGAGDGGSILLKDEFDSSYVQGVETIEFAGTVWTQADLRLKWLEQVSTAGNDTITGFNVNDTIRGGHGDDTIAGGAGDDSYVYVRGDGNDVITEGTAGNFSTIDKLILQGVDPASVTLGRNGNDATLIIAESAPGAGDGGSILLKDEYETAWSQGVETILFAGETWTQADLRLKWLAQSSTAGNDTIVGFTGADTIQGGVGTDTLSGRNEGDTYVYAAGDGEDVIDDQGGSGANALVLHGIAVADVTIVRNANDAILLIGDHGAQGRITIRQQFNSATTRISSIAFDDGTVWTDQTILANAIANDGLILTHSGTAGDDTITGTSDIDVIDGGAGADTLRGEGAGDTYRWGSGSGNDTIYETSATSGTDTVRLAGLNPSDLTFLRSGNDLRIKINASGETLKVDNQFNGTNGIEQLVFANGATWDRAAMLAAVWMVGTSAAETIYGSADAETIDGLAGNDDLRGGGSGDTYIFGAGSGNDTITESSGDAGDDKIRLVGLNAADVQFARASNDLFVKINATGETLKVTNQFNGTNGIEQVIFADGSTMNRTALLAAAWFIGTSAAETIYGSADADTFDGLAGNDNLRGAGSGDTYIYGAGSGNDLVSEFSNDAGDDKIKLVGLNAADVQFTRASNDLYIKITATGETLRVENQFNGTNGIEQVVFADGSTLNRAALLAAAWFVGTAGAETIYGSADADTFDGLGGNDNLRGQGSGDTYIYGAGSGNDLISEFSGDAGDDKIKLVGLNAADVEFSRSGVDLYIKITATGETLRVEHQFNGTNGIEQVIFADGTTWGRTQIADAAWFLGTSGNDWTSGTSSADVFFGGLGNDYARGNAGADIYIYASGHGNDEIDDQSNSTTDIDVLRFTNLNEGDITVSRVGSHLKVGINATGETIQIDYQFYTQNENWGVERFEFANGNTWDLQTINANAWYRGTSGNDTVSGSSWNDTIAGGAGNDTMSGSSGSDTFVFRSGLGQDVVTDFTAGSDVLEFRDGIFADAAAALAAASASGNNTLITIDSGNSILLQNVSLASLSQGDFHIV